RIARPYPSIPSTGSTAEACPRQGLRCTVVSRTCLHFLRDDPSIPAVGPGLDRGLASVYLRPVRKKDFAVLRFGWFASAVTLVAASAASAAEPMAPSEIQATFFTGQAFTARTPSGLKFKMTFAPDGKMTREPLSPMTKVVASKSGDRGKASTGT